MRVVTLEDHFLVPALLESAKLGGVGYSAELGDALADLGERRLRAMDESGITFQVISATVPGAEYLDGEEGAQFARATNDRLAEAVRRHPNRFAGFAHLPMRSPEAAADELERAVSRLGFRGALINGTTDGLFLDNARFAPILARAEALDVPIYIHPGPPPQSVSDAYYSDLPGMFGGMLARGLFGWHAEVGIHVLRLALSGAFERHPRLTVIIGHMGEMLPFMFDRIDHMMADQAPLLFGRQFESPSKVILDRVYITTSGVFSTPAFLCALTTFGADRILFSVDYPYSSAVPAKRWLDGLPVSPADKLKITHETADRLLKLGGK